MPGKFESKAKRRSNKGIIIFLCILIAAIVFVAISTIFTTVSPTEILSPVEQARSNVIDKWNNAQGELGTSKYIEDIYKKFSDDDTISNIYYYYIAKEHYGYYESLNNNKYLEQAIEYAEKIDPNYSGELATEIHTFVNSIIPTGISSEKHDTAKKQEDKYSSLSNSEKKKICKYIESRYEYYDNLSSGYSGDKYSDIIMEEAAQKYGLTVTQIEIIWMNMYSYK